MARICLYVVLCTVALILTGCFNPQADAERYANLPDDPSQQPTISKGPQSNSLEDVIVNLEREMWQKPNMIINRLGDLHNKTVADIGAGSGYFSFRLVNLAKKVLAIDIDTTAIRFINEVKQQLPDTLQSRLEARLCSPDDPKLKNQEVDYVILVNTYMFIENRVAYLKNLIPGMTKGAKILIIDYKLANIPFGPPKELRVPRTQVEQELKNAGFNQIVVDDTSLEFQYIVSAIRE